MAEEGTISIAVDVWEKRAAQYWEKVGINIRQGLYEEWPMLIRKVMDFTPPFKTKGGRGQSDLSIGRAAVASDIMKVMRPFDPAEIRSPAMKKIVDDKNVAAFNIVADRSKGSFMKGARAVAFSPEIHLRARNTRGRVMGRDRNQVVLGTDAALLKNYIVQVQAQVGYAKSGWLKALLLVGGEAPSFVTRHGTGGGDVIDDHANELEPSITAINRTPWAVRKDEGERIMADAYASRAVAIIAKMRTLERLARDQAGFTTS